MAKLYKCDKCGKIPERIYSTVILDERYDFCSECYKGFSFKFREWMKEKSDEGEVENPIDRWLFTRLRKKY